MSPAGSRLRQNLRGGSFRGERPAAGAEGDTGYGRCSGRHPSERPALLASEVTYTVIEPAASRKPREPDLDKPSLAGPRQPGFRDSVHVTQALLFGGGGWGTTKGSSSVFVVSRFCLVP
jgi:hypothetical protein